MHRGLLYVMLLAVLWTSALSAAQAEVDREIKMGPGRQSVTVRGKLGPSDKPAKYHFYGRAGQKCRIRIQPDGDLTTAGHLFVPDQQEGYGGPGGTIYDGNLPKTGTYKIWVERRSGKSNGFSLLLACDGSQRKR